MKKTIISVTSGMTIIAIAFSTLFYQPPAQAITTEEFLRLLGVWGRYAEDLHRTFVPGFHQPTPIPQPLPTTEPENPFNPPSNFNLP